MTQNFLADPINGIYYVYGRIINLGQSSLTEVSD